MPELPERLDVDPRVMEVRSELKALRAELDCLDDEIHQAYEDLEMKRVRRREIVKQMDQLDPDEDLED